jgi:hypothetical protein
VRCEVLGVRCDVSVASDAIITWDDGFGNTFMTIHSVDINGQSHRSPPSFFLSLPPSIHVPLL